MMRIHHIALTTCLAIVFHLTLVFAEDADKNRSRLEDLFRWKVSDTLQLTPQQEQKFSQVVHDLTDKRKKASERLDTLSEQMAKSKNVKETEKLIKEYQNQLKIYSGTQVEEIDSLRKVFGTEKLGKYLALKSDLSSRLKSAISGKTKSESENKVLEEPKVIESE